ncbi:MAG TPA: low affinity iron permease family protein [Brevundimonas sp.]|nr:low affinity iron permease family protein [Brevundimonas sp.]
MGHPYAVAALGVFSVAWFMVEAGNVGWDGVLASITMLATIVIQASQNRNTAAIQVKLDELIRVTKGARDDLQEIEMLPEEEIKKLRPRRRKAA